MWVWDVGVGYSKVDKKGRILIPKAFRNIFAPGTKVIIEVTPKGELLIRKAVDADEIIRKIRSIRLSGDKKAAREDAEKGKHMLWGN